MNEQVLLNKGASRPSVYAEITDSIVAAIEAGADAFTMPWHGEGAMLSKPENALTHMEYHGVNILALWAAGYVAGFSSGVWASYKQWRYLGAQVRKGERGSIIVFYKELGAHEETEEQEAASRLVARATYVFNADQIDGWEPKRRNAPLADFEPFEQVMDYVKATGADIHLTGRMACYHIDNDYIEMPRRELFVGSRTSTSREAYAATLLHELVHWTGAKHRLNRELETIRTVEDRAREELVAELGAAFLCADLWVSNVPRPDHAAYVASWLKALRDDDKAIFRAARLANAAANWLHEQQSP